MGKRIDLLGKTFGRWKVLELAPSRKNKRNKNQAFWKCVCSCGKIGEIWAWNLINGKSISCGCSRRDGNTRTGVPLKPEGHSVTNSIMYKYKRRSIRKGIAFNLSLLEFKKLIEDNCYYCGDSPKCLFKIPKSPYYNKKYNGIDRIDSNRGYELANVVTCCRFCNQAKSNLSREEFYSMVKKIYEGHVK